jgi:hypothetical protein
VRSPAIFRVLCAGTVGRQGGRAMLMVTGGDVSVPG